MINSLLGFYHAMPWPMRFVAASIHGWRLQRLRYGPETEKLVEEAHARESWSATQWKAWQGKRLEFVLHRAATEVPYYREHWAARRRSGDRSSYEYLENWPILEKETVQACRRAFLVGGCGPHGRCTETTLPVPLIRHFRYG